MKTIRMSLERFCIIRPVRRTSSGKRGKAIFTRLLTLKVAWSTSVPTSKVAVIVSVPLESALELKYNRFSTPLSCSSIGAATVLVSVSALAPGKVAVISTVGGAICGYWAMGNCIAAASPAKTMMMDNTDAKIGRVMKNLVMMIFRLGLFLGRAAAAAAGVMPAGRFAWRMRVTRGVPGRSLMIYRL